jgi:hypothetical protein
VQKQLRDKYFGPDSESSEEETPKPLALMPNDPNLSAKVGQNLPSQKPRMIAQQAQNADKHTNQHSYRLGGQDKLKEAMSRFKDQDESDDYDEAFMNYQAKHKGPESSHVASDPVIFNKTDEEESKGGLFITGTEEEEGLSPNPRQSTKMSIKTQQEEEEDARRAVNSKAMQLYQEMFANNQLAIPEKQARSTFRDSQAYEEDNGHNNAQFFQGYQDRFQMIKDMASQVRDEIEEQDE